MFSRESRALMKHPPPLTTTAAGQSNETSVEAGHDTQIIPQSPGPLQVRSTKGCWTCRLRKKKCDEIQPFCHRCTSVNIQCHFGPRPVWIEDCRLGKKELDRIKPTIAASAARKRAAFREKSRLVSQISPLQSPRVSGISEKEPHELGPSIDDSLSPMEVSFESALGDDLNCPVAHENPPLTDTAVSNSLAGDLEAHAASSSIIESRISSKASPQSFIKRNKKEEFGGNEANLMMHYLDNVFYIQFRFFTPSVQAGGRGWLLSLLNHTKPLYHAAISLSAFHQQSLISQQGADQAQIDYFHQLELHHNLTLEELQWFIRAHTESTSLGKGFGGKVQILACMVQLISFELFNGGTGKWQVHLGAGSKLMLELQSMLMENSTENSLQNSTRGTITKDFGCPNIAAFDFFASAIIWFDIIACVSTGSSPHLAEHHCNLISQLQPSGSSEHDTTFQLERIMGCQNWAMVIIGQIAVLANRHQENLLDAKQLAIAAKDIHDRLEYHNSQTLTSLQNLQREYRGPPPHYLSLVYTHYTTLVVTRIFSCTAIIYLQTVINAHPTIDHIQEPLKEVMSAMSLIPDPRMVRGMVWPLCIAGCMASSPADQSFFREKAEDAVKDAGMMGNSGKAMEILEMSWRMQRSEGRLVDCATCLRKLGTCVLLA